MAIREKCIATTTAFCVCVLFGGRLSAQTNDHHIMLDTRDSTGLRECFEHAHWEAHSRSYFMSTINAGDLKDDYAFASGAGIGVLTKPIYGFQLGISGFFLYNIFSSHINKADNITNLGNRYEVGLFDVEDLNNKNDLDRLEELYIKYARSRFSVSIGKLKLNTPFFNPQDSRMRPTLEEGIWFTLKEKKRIGASAGYIWEVSPRSTVRWFKLSESLGVYSQGVNEDGIKSNYAGNTQNGSGFLIANIYYRPRAGIKLSYWNGHLENVINTSVCEFNYETKRDSTTLIFNGLWFHQQVINTGGNSDPYKSYAKKHGTSNVFSTQAVVKYRRLNVSLSYTHITRQGRYLMPREWGREIFYTTLPRERIEGSGNVHAVMLKGTLAKKQLTGNLAYGIYKMPDVLNFALNKYGLPSFQQIYADVNYRFKKQLTGLELKLVLVYKAKLKKHAYAPEYTYNKIDMVNASVVLDFTI